MIAERRTAMSISSFPLQTLSTFKMLMIPYNEWVILNNENYRMSFRIGFYTSSCLASRQFNDELWYWCRHVRIKSD